MVSEINWLMDTTFPIPAYDEILDISVLLEQNMDRGKIQTVYLENLTKKNVVA